jgi:hypothetical protein
MPKKVFVDFQDRKPQKSASLIDCARAGSRFMAGIEPAKSY